MTILVLKLGLGGRVQLLFAGGACVKFEVRVLACTVSLFWLKEFIILIANMYVMTSLLF